MSDSSLTIDYTISSITNTNNGLSTIVWTLSHSGTALEEDRTGDKFRTSDLTTGISTSTDDGATKLTKLQANFENLATPYFQSFAKRVRAAQDQADAELLDELSGAVSGLSFLGGEENKKITGTVIVS